MFKWLRNLFKKKEKAVVEPKTATTSEKQTEGVMTTPEPKSPRTVNFCLKRTYYGTTYTIGKLFIDGEYFCDTLEDVVRQDGVKIYGETAIPTGKYDIILTYSPKFKRSLPLLLNVPNFTNIRIHNGSYATDSEGCILVGENKQKGMLTNSKKTIDNLMYKLNADKSMGKKFSIVIE